MFTVGRFDLNSASLQEVLARLFTEEFDLLLFQTEEGSAEIVVRIDHPKLEALLKLVPPHRVIDYTDHKRLYFAFPPNVVIGHILALQPDVIEVVDTVPDHK